MDKAQETFAQWLDRHRMQTVAEVFHEIMERTQPPSTSGRMSKDLRDFIEGMSVSVDVSTGDHDADHRLFGTISEVMDEPGSKHGVILLMHDQGPNFEPPSAPGERDVLEALDRLDALLDPKCGLLTVSDSSGTVQASRCDLALIRAALAPSPGIDAAEQKPVAWLTSDGKMLVFADKISNGRAQHSGMTPLYAAPPAAQPSADNAQFPFYELRFIMRVLSHEGSAPQEDWATAYGMARKVFEQWAKDGKAAAEWLAEAEKLVDAYAKEFAQGGPTYARDINRAALLAHLRTKPSTEQWCDTMDRPKSKCGCPDCGPSLIDLGPGLHNTPGKP